MHMTLHFNSLHLLQYSVGEFVAIMRSSGRQNSLFVRLISINDIYVSTVL